MHMKHSSKSTVIIMLAMLLCGVQAVAKTKIACVGNSITYGYLIPEREHNSYPAQLQAWLGDEYEVGNFSYPSLTLLNKGDKPYTRHGEYARSLAFNPDIELIKLGTNDSKPKNRQYFDEFASDFQALIDSYRALDSRPRIILMTPTRCFLPADSEIDSAFISGRIVPAVRDVARANDLEVINLHDLFGDVWQSHLMPDRLHPSSIGAGMIAQAIGRYLTRDTASGHENECVHPVPGNEFRSAAGWTEGSEWHAVADDIQLTLDGRKLDLLLLGNSITQGWGGSRKAVTYKPGKSVMDQLAPGLQWESAGISGDRTQNLLWRLQHYRYKVCSPRHVVIAIGVNNLIAGNNAEDIAEGIIRVTEEAEQVFPDSDILLLGLYPSGKEKGSERRNACERIHQLLGDYSFARARYADPTSWFTDGNGDIRDGLYGGDYIHFTPEGYRVATENILRLIGAD